jgi:glycerate 2-kinase
MSSPEPRKQLLEIFHAAISRVNGRNCVRQALASVPVEGRPALIAIGKAAVAMSQGALDVLNGDIVQGLVITKHGYEEALPWPVLTASHPVPDESSLEAGAALLSFIDQLPQDQPVLFLLSGGASSLAEVLPEDIGLHQLQQFNEWFLASGIDIVTGNEIRKRLSLIKGGRLAQRLYPRRVHCLTISDVPGDDPASIGSGPLVHAREFVLPRPVPDWLAGLVDSTNENRVTGSFDHVETMVVASISDAVAAAAAAARQYGYEVFADASALAGDVMQTGPLLAQQLDRSGRGTVHVWGGETTVTLPAVPGRGGRNQSLALAVAIALAGREHQYFLAAGTDGTDGPGEDAGGLVDGDTVDRGRQSGLDAQRCLRDADAGTFLEATGDLLATGPTGTNVMDIAIGLKQ